VVIITGVAFLALVGLYVRKYYITPFFEKMRKRADTGSDNADEFIATRCERTFPTLAQGKVRFNDRQQKLSSSTGRKTLISDDVSVQKKRKLDLKVAHQRLAAGRRRRRVTTPPHLEEEDGDVYRSDEEYESPSIERRGRPTQQPIFHQDDQSSPGGETGGVLVEEDDDPNFEKL
jgi:hypothetical protein